MVQNRSAFLTTIRVSALRWSESQRGFPDRPASRFPLLLRSDGGGLATRPLEQRWAGGAGGRKPFSLSDHRMAAEHKSHRQIPDAAPVPSPILPVGRQCSVKRPQSKQTLDRHLRGQKIGKKASACGS